MVNYNNGKIYKIEPKCEHSEGDIYIGSTTKQYLSQRMDSHRRLYKQWKNENNPKHTRSYDLFDKYGLENCEIILIENVNCDSKEELHRREAFHIKSNKCVNVVIPLRTEKEYYEEHKQRKFALNKMRYQENAEVREKVKLSGKAYRDANKELIKERKRLYREKNKDKIKAKQSLTYVCECGKELTKAKKNRHEQTKRHQELMKQNEKI